MGAYCPAFHLRRSNILCRFKMIFAYDYVDVALKLYVGCVLDDVRLLVY